MTRALKTLTLGFQHLIAMFGATILVPIITGLSPAVALFGAGAGTLLFHLITKGKVPVFLGSSFAFITGVLIVKDNYGLPYATGGIMVAGALYLVFAAFVRKYGVEKIQQLFPPVITGTMIMVIGLTLAPILINGNIVFNEIGTYTQRWVVAAVSAGTIMLVSVFMRGFFKMVPILFGIAAGYGVALGFGFVNMAPVAAASWLAAPEFFLPRFNWGSVLTIAPIALVTFMEHIGDITTNGAVVGKNFIADPGLDKTLIGDGVATMFAGLIGAPANTTYGENTAVLAVTKVYDPKVLRYAALMAVGLSFVGKFSAILNSIPAPVMGGVSIILFGMIAAIGLKTIVDAKVDYTKTKNLLISASMLVLGLSGVSFTFNTITVSGLSLAAIVGIVLNLVLIEEVL